MKLTPLVSKLLETFGFAEEQPETTNLKAWIKQNKQFQILVQSFQWKFIILCREIVFRNLPKSSLKSAKST